MSCFTVEHKRIVELLSNSADGNATNPCAEDLRQVYVNKERKEWIEEDVVFVSQMKSLLAQSGLSVYLKQLEDEKAALAAKVCVFCGMREGFIKSNLGYCTFHFAEETIWSLIKMVRNKLGILYYLFRL